MPRKNYYGYAYDLPKSDNRLKKFKKQRKKWGFDDTETWSLDATIIKFVLPRLKRFKKISTGLPTNLELSKKDRLKLDKKYEKTKNATIYSLTEKEWDNILDKMIRAMELYLEDEYWYAENKNTLEKELKEGFELFHKYFNELWW